MKKAMTFGMAVCVLVAMLLISVPSFAKILGSYDALNEILPGSNDTVSRSLKIVEKQQAVRERRDIEFSVPREILFLNNRYISVSFDANVKKQGSARMKPVPAVFALLFEKKGNTLEFFNSTYLAWIGSSDVEEYKTVTPAKISEYYRAKGAEYVFYDKKTPKPKAAEVNINGSDIKSGVVREAYIDSALTRDTELHMILENYAKKEDEKPGMSAQDAQKIKQLEDRVRKLEALLSSITRNGNDIIFKGVNVHIENGTGSTSKTNGTGNLIVGYGSGGGGSHNIAVGNKNKISSYGCIVSGSGNTASGKFSAVTGGSGNDASGDYASIAGGKDNVSSGDYSTILGGSDNKAKGTYSSINGQRGRTKVDAGDNKHFTN